MQLCCFRVLISSLFTVIIYPDLAETATGVSGVDEFIITAYYFILLLWTTVFAILFASTSFFPLVKLNVESIGSDIAK